MRTILLRRGLSAILAAVLGAGALAGCSAGTAASVAGTGAVDAGTHGGHGAEAPDDPRLSVDEPRRGAEVLAAGGEDAPYNYGPTAMADAAQTRMWWCSQAARPVTIFSMPPEIAANTHLWRKVAKPLRPYFRAIPGDLTVRIPATLR